MAERRKPKLSEDAQDRRMGVGIILILGGWSKADLSAAAGVSESSLSRYMIGAHAPSPETFQRITAAAGLAPRRKEFLGWVRAFRQLLSRRDLPPEFPPEAGGAELGRALGILLRDARLEREAAGRSS